MTSTNENEKPAIKGRLEIRTRGRSGAITPNLNHQRGLFAYARNSEQRFMPLGKPPGVHHCPVCKDAAGRFKRCVAQGHFLECQKHASEFFARQERCIKCKAEEARSEERRRRLREEDRDRARQQAPAAVRKTGGSSGPAGPGPTTTCRKKGRWNDSRKQRRLGGGGGGGGGGGSGNGGGGKNRGCSNGGMAAAGPAELFPLRETRVSNVAPIVESEDTGAVVSTLTSSVQVRHGGDDGGSNVDDDNDEDDDEDDDGDNDSDKGTETWTI